MCTGRATPSARRAATAATVRTCVRLFVAGIRRQSTYRLAALGGLVANTTFGLLKVQLLLAAVTAGGGALAGYDAPTMGSYIWLSQALLGSVNLHGRSDTADRIRSGDIAVDFLRPLDVQLAAVTTDVGRATFSLLPRGLPTLAIGVLVVDVAVPRSPGGWALGALAVALGITVSAAAAYVVAATGFWLVETRGVAILYMVLSGFLAGLFVPIALFPGWLLTLAEATPFPSMLMYPVDVLSGRMTGSAALRLVGFQVAWLAGVVLLGQLMTRAGRHRLEVQGG